LFITDGLSNVGLSSEETLETIRRITLPTNCVFNTFGFGEEHDSKLLLGIALKTQGSYYYVKSSEELSSVFNKCIEQGIMKTRVCKLKIKLLAQDGSRIIILSTPYQTTEFKNAKEYDIDVGLLYSGDHKSILFRLSLRKMNELMENHHLLRINIQYFDIATTTTENITTDLNVARGTENIYQQIPLRLDENLNRYNAIKTIIESIELANKSKFREAQEKMNKCITEINESPSGGERYCKLLVQDLRECNEGMLNDITFQTGVHNAFAHASKFYMETELKLYGNPYLPNLNG